MKHLLLLAFLFAVVGGQSQIVLRGTTTKAFRGAMGHKTMIVLLGKEDYDKKLMEGVEKYWKLTPYEFISGAEFAALIDNEELNFLFPMEYVTTTYSKYGTYTRRRVWLSWIPGGRKELSNYSVGDILAIAPYNNNADEYNPGGAAYRVDYMIKALNDGIHHAVANKYRGNDLKMLKRTSRDFKRDASVIKKKTLIVNKDFAYEDKPIVKEKDLEGYPYKVKLVSNDVFQEIMKGEDPRYVCLMPALEVNRHVFVVDPATRETVYYDFNASGLRIKKSDFKKIARAASR